MYKEIMLIHSVIYFRHDYTQLDIFENAKKVSRLCLPCQENTQRSVRSVHKRKGNAKKVCECCACTHTKPNTHNTSLTFYLTITATSCRTELALTYLPNLSSLYQVKCNWLVQ